jgi:nucleoside-diphosphate-sugar epimerase
MRDEKADVVIFGYGALTNEIIKNFVFKKLKVICITNQSCYLSDYVKSKNFKKYSYLEAIKLRIITNSTVFAWRDSSTLVNNNEALSKWLETNSYQTTKSFLLSSASVYMDTPEPLDESEYNISIDSEKNEKLILEKKLSNLMKKTNVNHLNLRISNVYGSNLKYGFIGSLLESIKSNTKVNVFQNTKIVRDYVYIQDVVQAVEKLLEIEINGANLNISTGIGTSISEVLDIFANKGYKFENRNTIVSDEKIRLVSILDCKKLSYLIDWNPESIYDVINRLLPNKLY